MTDTLDWMHATTSIGQNGLVTHREATPAELKAVAKALDVISVERLEARYMIKTLRRSRYLLSGEVKARLTQACVVTLDPVPTTINEPFSVEFWPAEDIPVADTDSNGEHELEALGDDPPEPLDHSRISAGRIIYETLAAALDPYPRLPDAQLERTEAVDDPAATTGQRISPFAALAKLKKPEH
jgi:uncharacterized metal-binding protein YceD (DUF177 family)